MSSFSTADKNISRHKGKVHRRSYTTTIELEILFEKNMKLRSSTDVSLPRLLYDKLIAQPIICQFTSPWLVAAACLSWRVVNSVFSPALTRFLQRGAGRPWRRQNRLAKQPPAATAAASPRGRGGRRRSGVRTGVSLGLGGTVRFIGARFTLAGVSRGMARRFPANETWNRCNTADCACQLDRTRGYHAVTRWMMATSCHCLSCSSDSDMESPLILKGGSRS